MTNFLIVCDFAKSLHLAGPQVFSSIKWEIELTVLLNFLNVLILVKILNLILKFSESRENLKTTNSKHYSYKEVVKIVQSKHTGIGRM